MAKTRDEMIEELKNAGETVAFNIKTEALVGKYTTVFGEALETPKKSGKKKVVIHSNDRENDEVEVVVGINGVLHQIKIGEEVEVDPSIIKVLNNAVETRYESVLDGKGQPTGEIKEVPRKRYLVESVVEDV